MLRIVTCLLLAVMLLNVSASVWRQIDGISVWYDGEKCCAQDADEEGDPEAGKGAEKESTIGGDEKESHCCRYDLFLTTKRGLASGKNRQAIGDHGVLISELHVFQHELPPEL